MEPEVQWRRLDRPALFDKLIGTLSKVRESLEQELVRAKEELDRAKGGRGG